MSQAPSFVPRDLLVVPGYFETQEPKNLQWHLATDYAGAVRLAWAMQQQCWRTKYPEEFRRDDVQLVLATNDRRLG